MGRLVSGRWGWQLGENFSTFLETPPPYPLFPIPKQRRRGLLISPRNKLWKWFCCTPCLGQKSLRSPPRLYVKNNFPVEKQQCFNPFSCEIIFGVLRQKIFHVLYLSVNLKQKIPSLQQVCGCQRWGLHFHLGKGKCLWFSSTSLPTTRKKAPSSWVDWKLWPCEYLSNSEVPEGSWTHRKRENLQLLAHSIHVAFDTVPDQKEAWNWIKNQENMEYDLFSIDF